MSNDRPASGSRWEPHADPPDPASQAGAFASGDARPPEATTEATTAPHPAAPPWSAPAPTSPGPLARRGRVRLVAGTAGLLVLGGIGGFWLGHATAASPGPGSVPGIGAHQHRDHLGDRDGNAPGSNGDANNGGVGGTTGGGIPAPGDGAANGVASGAGQAAGAAGTGATA